MIASDGVYGSQVRIGLLILSGCAVNCCSFSVSKNDPCFSSFFLCSLKRGTKFGDCSENSTIGTLSYDSVSLKCFHRFIFVFTIFTADSILGKVSANYFICLQTF